MYNKSVILPFEQSKEDERGYIKSIINQPSTNTSIIMCKPGSVRANHYHLKDWHYMYVLEGKMDYFFFDNQLGKVCYFSLEKDQIIFNPNDPTQLTNILNKELKKINPIVVNQLYHLKKNLMNIKFKNINKKLLNLLDS